LTVKRIVISIGDAAGVGPELALRVAARSQEFPSLAMTLVGDVQLLHRVATAVGLPVPRQIDQKHLCDKQPFAAGCADVLSIGQLDAAAVYPGQWSADTGKASHVWVQFAAQATQAGRFDAVVTGPIQKEAWYAAGIAHPGHTEFLAELTGATNVRMMLTSEEISCVLATIHIPLADVASVLTSDDVYQAIVLGAEALERKTQRVTGRTPRVTVCGLNPHAGEHGMFSHREEENIIIPAIERARATGIDVTGPLSPDTAFVPARRRITDVYVCMYHDQGLIPLKALAFDDAVNVTLGLPIVRTSVDHGTAMDIAWKGTASESSLCAAVRLAGELA
jgi:4-phospho-D-threonate 3-dehydrogenase / 4-phospho-D-erythronate 3-dehydrogenase